MSNSKFAGVCAGFGITLIWSSWILATRLGLRTEISVYDLLALRFFVACALAVPILWYLGTWKGLSPARYIIVAILGGLPQNILTYEAVARSPAGVVSVFMYGTAPIMTALIAYLFWRKKFSLEQIFGTAVVFAGVLIMSAKQFSGSFDMQMWQGNLMAVGAIASFAGFFVVAERWQVTLSQGIAACTVLNGFVYLPIWYLFLDSGLGQTPWDEIAMQGALQGLVPALLAIFLTTFTAGTIGAGPVSLFYAMIPLCAATFAVPVLGEMMNDYQKTGIVVATIGIVMASGEGTALIKRRFSRAV